MQVWGIDPATAYAVTPSGIRLDAERVDSRSIRVKAFPARDSRMTYARRSARTGRLINGLCTHGFEALITALFEAGATRVRSMMGDWRSLDAFRASVPAINRGHVNDALRGAPPAPSECDHR